ncbi:MAG: Coenzyme F420 hydrogenase/dehydrogenase, beta subunit C-terminal domain [Bacteroidaceae bacterium]|nr:Coenzyme F420 hydrogenase/dehydrogenase, beta subunit C-terminal domain [Bacteroidaceae bacterium]
MIEIVDKKACCGCGACAQRCPQQCITMQSDKEGFAYPVVDTAQCTGCGLCERVCPVINQQPARQPIATYAATNSNQAIRETSSSGGIFTLLAQQTINNGGVVFGATFNSKWEVEHTFVESTNDISKLRGSKYVQSRIGDSYRIAEKFLKEGRKVLFSGTPCQIAGLKRFLRKEYDNLTTVDIVCHGSPSPWVWQEYLNETCTANGIADITDIQFRNKAEGWKNYSFVIKYTNSKSVGQEFRETMGKNLFMKCFLSDLCLRPSCYRCPARSGKSGSDITLADLWGAQHICPQIDDNLGLSLVMVRRECNLPQCNKTAIPYSEALKYNPSIERDAREPKRRRKFFAKARKHGICQATVQCTSKSRLSLLWKRIKEAFKHKK